MEIGTENKGWAVVTGASTGIGFELAKQFVDNGFNVLVTAENEEIKDVGTRLGQSGAKVLSVQADLRTEEGVRQLYEQIKPLGAIEAAAINAGVGVSGPFDANDLTEELDLIRLNIMSTVHLTKLLLNDMMMRGHGRILFTSSIAAFMPGPYSAVYNASKAFIQSFAEALHAEMKDKSLDEDIFITALQPGPTETEFFKRARMENTKVGQAEKDDAEIVAKQGYEALMSGEHAVIAGSFKNKLEGVASKILPQETVAKMHAKQAKPEKPGDLASGQ